LLSTLLNISLDFIGFSVQIVLINKVLKNHKIVYFV